MMDFDDSTDVEFSDNDSELDYEEDNIRMNQWIDNYVREGEICGVLNFCKGHHPASQLITMQLFGIWVVENKLTLPSKISYEFTEYIAKLKCSEAIHLMVKYKYPGYQANIGAIYSIIRTYVESGWLN